MIILAHLIMQNSEWKGTSLRLLRVAPNEQEVAKTRQELEQISAASRITTEIHIPISAEPFPKILREHSENASLILLGFIPPKPEGQLAFFETMNTMLTDMPTTMFVNSSGEADLLA